ncbi:MAG: hypothetical protein AAF393_12915 [Pseudomonadota bacterium]
MRHLIAPTATAFLVSLPAQADDSQMDDFLKRFEDMSKEAQTLMERWAEDLAPKLEELAPALEDLMAKMGDLSAYHPPEVLPNGDIIIRRKSPQERNQTPEVPSTPEPGGEIEL